MNTLQDRIRGSLIGGAIGDALGYPVEFVMSYKGIQKRYGERGITRFDIQNGERGKAIVSDDTQMTLFTANGLLNAKNHNILPIDGIRNAYIEWYLTQIRKKSPKYSDCWLSDVPELNHRRAPGNTCMSSLDDIYRGMEPMNDSKGCGGVMRVAPIPLYAVVDSRMDEWDASKLACDSAYITHRHPLGILSAAMLSNIIYYILKFDFKPEETSLSFATTHAISEMYMQFSSYGEHVDYLNDLTSKANDLAYNGRPDVENISSLGGGWTGDEALAIAIYCAERYSNSFEEAMIAAVNHGGDSDSTGAVTGNILGAAIGYEAIPQFYKDDLEMHDLILHMADDLYRGEVTKM